MAGGPIQVPPDVEGTHLVLYDGVCGLCSRLIQFLLARDRRGVFSFAALQSALGRQAVERFGGDPDALTTFYVVSNYRTADARLFARSGAALFLAGEVGWPWKAAALLRILPEVMRDPLYDLVARSRYRWFGQLDRCLLPRPEYRRRFIDA